MDLANKYQNICILRLSAIGDVCNTISAVQLIQKNYPNSNITWIVGKTEAEVLKPLSNIKLIIYNKKNGVSEYFKIWKELKTYKFDILLNMQTAFRASILSLGIKAKEKVGFDKTRARELQSLFTNKQIKTANNAHVVDGFIEFAKYLGITDTKPSWLYPISTENKEKISKFLSKDKPNAIIAPCSSKKEKDWTIDGYVAVAKYLQQQGYHIIITGSNNTREVEFTDAIINKLNNITSAVGETSLAELISLINEVELVITPDSAAIHMANMMNIKVVGLYAYHNPLRTGPYYQIDHVVSVYEQNIIKYYKKPSVELPWATKAKGENLMQQISVEMVIDKICQIINCDKE